MSKDSYNIDNILSEVKKRREENEREIKAKAIEEQATNEVADAPKEEIAEETIEKEPEKAPAEEIIEQKPEAAAEIVEEIAEEKAEEAVEEATEEVVDAVSLDEIADSKSDEAVELQEDEYLELDDKPEKKKMSPKKKKALKIVIIILVVLIVGAAIFAVVFFNGLLDQLLGNKSDVYNTNNTSQSEEWPGMNGNIEVFDPIYETEATELSSLQDMIKTWYYNGKPCSSNHVLNVLLIGEDTRGSEILDDGTRADAAIIASINADTKQITLTSILRDTYSYFESTPNNEETGTFEKINGAMSIGDIGAYINCVESLYKINIDNYVIVNFDSFETIVNSLGGVTLELTRGEINEINNHPKRYGNVYIEKTFEGQSGEILLNGEQALAYCRIRKLDSDNMRADRQKTCLITLFNQMKNASTSQILKLATNLVPYVSTGFSKDEILKIAEYALKEKWLSFSTQATSVPYNRINESGAGGTYYGAWCWKSDYPADANYLQMLIYGKSNITLAHQRVDVLKCPEKGYFSQGAAAVGEWARITNDHYGEVTTIETTIETTTESTTTSN